VCPIARVEVIFHFIYTINKLFGTQSLSSASSLLHNMWFLYSSLFSSIVQCISVAFLHSLAAHYQRLAHSVAVCFAVPSHRQRRCCHSHALWREFELHFPDFSNIFPTLSHRIGTEILFTVVNRRPLLTTKISDQLNHFLIIYKPAYCW